MSFQTFTTTLSHAIEKDTSAFREAQSDLFIMFNFVGWKIFKTIILKKGHNSVKMAAEEIFYNSL